MREEHFRKLERMYASGRANEYFRPSLVVHDGAAEVSVDVRPDFFHAAGAVHGAVYFKLLDDAAFFAVNSRIEDVFVLTVSFNVHLLRPISEGKMVARGRLVHSSRRLHVAESELFAADGRQLGRGSGTFTRSKIELSPALGYV